MKPKRWRCPVCGARWRLVDNDVARPVGVRQLYGVCVADDCPVTVITVTIPR